MSRAYSRREIANWAIDQLKSGTAPKKLSRKLAAIMVQTGRGKEAELLMDDISSELELRGVLAQLKITSATKLTAELRKYLVNYVKNTAKVSVVSTSEQTDHSVLGGFKLETSTRTWDKTVARQLADIKGGL